MIISKKAPLELDKLLGSIPPDFQYPDDVKDFVDSPIYWPGDVLTEIIYRASFRGFIGHYFLASKIQPFEPVGVWGSFP